MEKMKLMRALWRCYPRRYAEPGDYIGLQIGQLKAEIRRIIVALDFDETILEAARDFRPDLILTHHPFIYGTPKAVLSADEKKAELARILVAELETAVVSLHTNFDAAPGGMNDLLADCLDLINVYRCPAFPMMRIGKLENAMEIEVFIDYFMHKTGIGYAGLVNAGSQTIRKIAFIAGGGSGYFRLAQAEGADIFVSGDCPHHVRRDIIRYGMNYLDVPHEIERLFVPALEKTLLSIDPQLEVLPIDHEKETKIYSAR